jgi:hypothetical protein
MAQKVQSTFFHHELGAHVGLFIVGDQGSYYNALNNYFTKEKSME